MKKLILLTLLLTSFKSQASIWCGIKPITKPGCGAMCICGDDNRCEWIEVCD